MGVSAQSDTTYDLHTQVFSGLESGTWVAPLPPQILSKLETKSFLSNNLLLLPGPHVPNIYAPNPLQILRSSDVF